MIFVHYSEETGLNRVHSVRLKNLARLEDDDTCLQSSRDGRCNASEMLIYIYKKLQYNIARD